MTRPSHAGRTVSFMLILASLPEACSTAPPMTPESRRSDIEFLAHWAREYSPFVELNEKLRGLPNYETLAPRYAQWAAEAKTETEFLQVVCGYFSLLGVSGHGHLLSEPSLRTYHREGRRHPGQLPRNQLKAGYFWPRLEEKTCFGHPPFRVVHDGGVYRTADDWRSQGRLIPEGSQILRVNGMPCSAYLDWVRKETWIRHIPRDTDWITRSLLTVHHGQGFRGWQVVFHLPDGSAREAFVPWRQGSPAPTAFADYGAADGNCVCLSLTDEAGYIRVKCMGSMFIEKDGRKIRSFLEDAKHRFRTLIIDVRQNGGGLHYYGFDNLIAPFLDESASYSEIAGIRRPFLAHHKSAFLEALRRGVSIFAHERNIREIPPPEGWDETRWVFYKIDRRVDPRPRYNFHGRLFILMDGGTGSAADEYVSVAQRIGLATLVGQRTPGSCGPYFNPVMVRLPASGMIFVLEADLMLNRDGSVNEIAGTKPDIECPPSLLPERVTREELLRDPWIQRILAEPASATSPR